MLYKRGIYGNADDRELVSMVTNRKLDRTLGTTKLDW